MKVGAEVSIAPPVGFDATWVMAAEPLSCMQATAVRAFAGGAGKVVSLHPALVFAGLLALSAGCAPTVDPRCGHVLAPVPEVATFDCPADPPGAGGCIGIPNPLHLPDAGPASPASHRRGCRVTLPYVNDFYPCAGPQECVCSDEGLDSGVFWFCQI